MPLRWLMQNERLIERLNNKLKVVKKMALKELKKREKSDPSLVPGKAMHEVNLNVHTHYSFAPYSPSLAAYMAYKSGIKLACSCDYGNDSGHAEFSQACEILNLNCVRGFELTLKSPSLGECVCSFYSVSEECAQKYSKLLEEFRGVCYERAKKVCEKINKKLFKFNLSINFETDVASLVKDKKGATLTLKHLYQATSEKIIEKYGKGRKLAEFLRTTLCLDIEESSYNLLCDANNPFYIFDLISSLRNNFNGVEAGLTPPSTEQYVKIANENGAIAVYEYDAPNNWLKNQTESDKTLAEFDKIVDKAKEEGFKAISISKHNLSDEMVEKFICHLEQKQMLVVFTEKTEYPRNHFECAAPKNSVNYIQDCAYAILGNEISIAVGASEGMFGEKNLLKCPDFEQRLQIFAQIGKKQL